MHAAPQLHIFCQMVRVYYTFHDAEPDFYIACTQQEVLKGNYVAFKCFCTHMSVVENNDKELIIIQINNSFMCIIFINTDVDYIKSIL
jgi:hypothetical protein